MKAEDYLIIPRSEIEGRLNKYRKSYSEPENFSEYRMLEDMEASSRPLLSLLEKAWDDCIYEADRTLIEPDRDFTHARIDYEAINEFKHLFLNSDI